MNRAAGALCGAGAVALAASTFLHWYPGDDSGIQGAYFERSVGAPAHAGVFEIQGDGWWNAWEALTVVDVVLAVIALVSALAAVLLLLRPGHARHAGAAAAGAGAVGLALVAWKAVDDPYDMEEIVGVGTGPGITLAACAALTIVFGGVLAATRARPPRPSAR